MSILISLCSTHQHFPRCHNSSALAPQRAQQAQEVQQQEQHAHIQQGRQCTVDGFSFLCIPCKRSKEQTHRHSFLQSSTYWGMPLLLRMRAHQGRYL